MNFAEAEVKYRELRKQMDLGKPIRRVEFEEQVSKLTVQDENGTWWEIHPHVGRWMYYDQTRWVYGVPPGRASSEVVPPTSKMANSTSAPTSIHGSIVSPETLVVRNNRRSANRIRQRFFVGANRPWNPLVIAAIFLFVCACVTFFGGQFILGGMAPTSEPTQTLVVRIQTFTPVPTITPQPTLPLPTVTPSPVIGKIIETRVNVRAAPSLQANIIGKVTRDEQITLVGRSEDGAWYQVQIAGIPDPGWVFGETMEVISGNPTGLPIYR